MYRQLAVWSCAVALGLTAALTLPRSVHADTASWQKGADLLPTSSEDFSSDATKQALRNLAATGANYAILIIPIYQTDINSTNIHNGGNTPSDASLINAITAAHSDGLNVMLKPHLDVEAGDWRAMINPSDRASWFASYGTMLNHYATLAKQQGVEGICIGAELYKMTTPEVNSSNTSNWQNLIAGVRSQYSGSLTYSAQRPGYAGEFDKIQFWPQLDYLGISAYYDFTDQQFSTVDTLKAAWNNINNNQIKPVVQRYNKPLLITEVGYRSATGAHRETWADLNDGSHLQNPDQAEQAKLYTALFAYWSSQSFVQGIHLWQWETNPNAGGNGSATYTPQNKQAQYVMRQWFTGNGTTTTPTPTPAAGNVTAQLTISPISPIVGNVTQINSSVTSTTPLSDTLIDLEVYDSNNQRVWQHYVEHQNAAANTPISISGAWTPNTTGNYTAKIGVFTAGWSSNLLWLDHAKDITVTNGAATPSPTPTPTPTTPPTTPTPTPSPTPTPTPSTAKVSIWWPANGTSVSGTQPFKAVVDGWSLASYNLYWQVDGGQLNPMNNSNQEADHKESWVDVSGWNWRGNGPYVITFVAKDNQNNTLGSASTSITISR